MLWLARATRYKGDQGLWLGRGKDERGGRGGCEEKGEKKVKGAEHRVIRHQMVFVGAGQIKFSTFSLGGCHAYIA